MPARSSSSGPGASGAAGASPRPGRGGGRATAASRSTVGSVSISEMYRGHLRLELIGVLAMGEVTFGDISRQLGCYVADVKQFAEDFRQEIEEVRAAMAKDVAMASDAAGLWIAKKKNRIAEIQADVDDINSVLDIMRQPYQPPGQDLGSKRHVNLLRLKLAALKGVAEELEPRRSGSSSQADGDDGKKVVHYVIEDPDLEAMT